MLGEMVNHLKYGDDTTLMVESEEELKNHLMRVEKESEEASVKLSIKKQTKIIASSPFTSLQIEGEKVETVTDFLFLGSKSLRMVTAAMKLEDDCFFTGKL